MLPARSIAATAVLALTALLVAGCALPAAEPTPEPTVAPTADTTTTPTATETTPTAATATATPTADTEVIDTTSWLEFATDDGTISFRYPEDWTLEASTEWFSPDGRDDVDGPFARWMDTAALTAPNGQRLLQMADFVDIGGACDAGSWRPLEVLAVEDGPGPGVEGETVAQIATVALGSVDGRWTVGVGIVGDEWLESEQTCRFVFASSSSDGGVSIGSRFELTSAGDDPLWTVATLDDARDYMQTAEYATVVEILRSVEIA